MRGEAVKVKALLAKACAGSTLRQPEVNARAKKNDLQGLAGCYWCRKGRAAGLVPKRGRLAY